MSKPTLRNAGCRMVTLRVRQDLALDELAHAFWASARTYGSVEVDGFPQHSAAAVREAVAKYLSRHGASTNVYDDEEFTGSAEAQRWAFEHVARAYGFDEDEIPEPEVDERAARRIAADAAYRASREDGAEFCEIQAAQQAENAGRTR